MGEYLSWGKKIIVQDCPQANQQTEPKQRKSEVEEICIYQNLESAHHSI